MEQCTEKTLCQVNGYKEELRDEQHPPSKISPIKIESPVSSPTAVPDLLTLYTAYQKCYQEQISVIGNTKDANDKEKLELDMLRNYLEQVEELNSVLITTMTELQKEVEERVVQMEKRLKSSAKTTMESVINLHDCEQEINRLVNDKLHLESLLSNVQSQVSATTVENNLLRDQNFNLDHDIQALLHIIHHARSTGHWEMECVTFCEVTPEQVFGPVQSLDHFKKPIAQSLNSLSRIHNNKQKKCLSHENHQSIDIVKMPSTKADIEQRCVSLPIIIKPLSRINTINWTSSKSFGLERRVDGLSTSDELKNTLTQDSCDLTQRTSYDPFIRRAYSEPHLFIFGDSIYVYRPCESPHQDLQACDEAKLNGHACQSIDLKLPVDETSSKYIKSCKRDYFCNSKIYRDSNATSLPCNMEKMSFASSTTVSEYDGNSLANGDETREECSRPDCCSCIKESFKVHQRDACFYSRTHQGIQTDNTEHYAIGLQTSLGNNNLELITNGAGSTEISVQEIKRMKENLLRAEDKVSAQVILIKELQTHLNTIMKEVAEREDKIKDLKSQQEILQNQKRSLMIQLDAQGDDYESTKNEVQVCKRDLHNFVIQMEQQSIIIKSLQEALVQSKRALDEANVTVTKSSPFSFISNNKKSDSNSMQNSRSSIVDL